MKPQYHPTSKVAVHVALTKIIHIKQLRIITTQLRYSLRNRHCTFLFRVSSLDGLPIWKSNPHRRK